MDDYNLILTSFAELDGLEDKLVPGVRVIAPELDHGIFAADDPLVTRGHRARIPNLAGADHIKGLARNLHSGERCAAKVSI
jgi:hypothetical protein